MDYLKNHCWCTDSNWGGSFECKIIVRIGLFEESDEEDYLNMTVEQEHFSQHHYEKAKNIFNDSPRYTEEFYRDYATRKVRIFKQEVIDWLEKNVLDSNGKKMWAVGSIDYNFLDGSGRAVFFQRRKDAMAFIKRWSKWKKPIYYTQYFTDVRKKLNLQTLKYEDR